MRARRILRWVGWTFGALLLLIACGVTLLETPWGHDRVRRLAVSQAARLLNGRLEIGTLSGSLFTQTTLREVVLWQQGQPVMRFSEIHVEYHPMRFFSGDIVLDRLTASHPDIELTETATGWNVTNLLAPRPTSTSTTRRFVIHDLDIEDGVVRIQPRGAAPRDLPIAHLRGSLVVSSTGFRLDSLDLATAATQATGYLRRVGAIWDVGVRADPLASADVAAYVPSLRHVEWSPHGTFRMSGPTDRLSILWDVDSSSGSVAGTLTGNVAAPTWTAAGEMRARALDLSVVMGRPQLVTRLTGRVTFDATIASTGTDRVQSSFVVDAPQVEAVGYRATDVRASGAIRGDVITADGTLRAYGADATANGHVRLSDSSFAWSGRMGHLDLRQLPAMLHIPTLSSNLGGRYHVVSAPGRWTADVTLATSTLEGATLAPATTARVAARGREVQYATDGRVGHLNLDRVLRVLGRPRDARLVSDVSGSFHLEGAGDLHAPTDHSARVSLALAHSRVADVDLDSLRLDGSLGRRQLTADVDASLRHVAGQLPASIPQRDVSLNGRVQAHLVVHDITAPIGPQLVDGTATVELSPSTLGSIAIEHAGLDATLNAGVVRILALSLDGPVAKVTAAGSVALTDQGKSDLTYDIDIADLTSVGQLIGQPLAGGAHLTGALAGSRARLISTGTIQGHQLAYGTETALALAGKYEFEVPDLAISRLTASLNAESTFLEAGGVKIDRARIATQYADAQLDLDVTVEQTHRAIGVVGALRFEPGARELHLRQLAIGAAPADWHLANPAQDEGVIRFETDRISVSGLTLAHGDERIVVAGAVPLRGGDEASANGLTITFEHVRLADVDLTLAGTAQLDGTLDGTARLTGSIASPIVSIDAHILDGKAGGVPFQQAMVTGVYRDHVTTVNTTLDVDPTSRLVIAGTIPIAAAASSTPDTPALALRPIDLRVEGGSVSVALFQPLTSHVDKLDGKAEINLHVGGSIREPSVQGTIALNDVSFRVALTDASYRHLNAAVQFDGAGLRVDKLSVEDHDGHSLKVSGSLGPSGALGRSLNVQMVGEGFHVLASDLGELALDVDLRATGTIQAPRVEGTVTVDRGRLEVDRLLERLTHNAYAVQPAADPTAPAAGPPVSASPFGRTTLAVTLDLPDNLVLRGRGLKTTAGSSLGLGDINLTAGGRLYLTKASDAPLAIMGQAAIVRGQYSFQGRRFAIERGSEVRFRGETPIDPALHITATRDIASVVASVAVGATATRPTVTLSSDPPLDPGDVLSLIVFNQPINELGAAEQVSLAQRAGSLAVGALASPLSDSVARALDLDLFEIRAPELASQGPVVSLGRQLNEHLFVGFRHEFGRDENSSLSFEYQLAKRWRLITSLGQASQDPRQAARREVAGIDLIFFAKR